MWDIHNMGDIHNIGTESIQGIYKVYTRCIQGIYKVYTWYIQGIYKVYGIYGICGVYGSRMQNSVALTEENIVRTSDFEEVILKLFFCTLD